MARLYYNWSMIRIQSGTKRRRPNTGKLHSINVNISGSRIEYIKISRYFKSACRVGLEIKENEPFMVFIKLKAK